MGDMSDVIEARTLKELQRKVHVWARSMRESDFEIRAGWNRDRVQKAATGYRIRVSAHT